MHCRFESKRQTMWILLTINYHVYYEKIQIIVVVNQQKMGAQGPYKLQIKCSNMSYTFFPSPERMFAVPPSAKVSTVNVMLWQNWWMLHEKEKSGTTCFLKKNGIAETHSWDDAQCFLGWDKDQWGGKWKKEEKQKEKQIRFLFFCNLYILSYRRKLKEQWKKWD